MGFTQQQICKIVVSQPCRGGSVSKFYLLAHNNYSFGSTVLVALDKQENFQVSNRGNKKSFIAADYYLNFFMFSFSTRQGQCPMLE